MNLRTVSRWVVIAGTLLIWTVKFVIRPYIHIPAAWKPVFGMAPNLIGSFLLPFGACWLFEKIFGMKTYRELRIASWFGLILVVINEYLQLVPFFGRTFDYLDILSSFFGVFLGYLSYSWLMVRMEL
ncbi:MAG: hypothetical protein K0Q66_2104 [Chitinophagaceae bacterium]|nr:hypothetical protein [Chitinophagaceae bacterium]